MQGIIKYYKEPIKGTVSWTELNNLVGFRTANVGKWPNNGSPIDSVNEEATLTESARLLYLAGKGEWDDARTLLNSGQPFDLTLVDKEGFTALLLAAKDSRADIVELFASKGADISTKTTVLLKKSVLPNTIKCSFAF